MKKGKEEWKKQLEARFQDIEKYLICYAEKYKIVRFSLRMKPRRPMIHSWLSNINFKTN